MVWAKNGTPDTLTGTGDVLQITDLTAKKFNQFLTHFIDSGSVTVGWRFNANSSAVYNRRVSLNGGTDSTAVSQTEIPANNGSVSQFEMIYCCSISGKEKLVKLFDVDGGTAGAGTAPQRMEIVGKFVPSPDADITQVSLNELGEGDFDTSSNLSALGTD